MGLTSVGLYNSFTYLSLVHTQVINASLFNAAIPAIIILLCFLLKIEKTNKFQILGLVISVGGILAIITKLKLEVTDASEEDIKAVEATMPSVKVKSINKQDESVSINIEYQNSSDPRKDLFKYAVEKGWIIIGMSVQQKKSRRFIQKSNS